MMMKNLERIADNIYALSTPYKDIFTTVYIIKTANGALVFDTATYDCDVDGAILPALRELGIGENDLKYIFISHHHADHSGGLGRLLSYYPQVTVVSKSEALAEKFEEYTFLLPADGETLLDVLSVVSVTGHTRDAAALYDTRTKTLISGDCLQLYGVFGSGLWGANISFVTEYAAAIEKLRRMDIAAILTAHEYYPCGRMYFDKKTIDWALDACLAPFETIKELIKAAPDADDEQICRMYHARANLPKLAPRVVREYRKCLS